MRRYLPLAMAAIFWFSIGSWAYATPTVTDSPYPGMLTLSVDATDLTRRILRVHEEIPVKAGPLTLHYPQWLPGNHSPTGPIDQLAGIVIHADGKPVPWRRDPLDVYSLQLQVPEGVSQLMLDFQFLSPLDKAQGRVVVTPEMLGLQWNAVVLYPAGYNAANIQIQPSLQLPTNWQFGSALEVAKQSADHINFKPVSLEMLIDSPLFAGKYFQRFDLDPGGKLPVYLNVIADTAQQLEAKPEVISKHRALVQQAYRLYGTPHFRHYDFLLALSDRFSGIGLEHHQSSENSKDIDYLTDAKTYLDHDLLAHEFTHSWNGKFRRGADLATANFNVPMQNSLLWMYEGQTEYWGYVLATRSGLLTQQQTRDYLALVAAAYDHREGRVWRDLQDTTLQPIISYRGSQGWRNWQRGRDYYSESQLVWLDADTLIREKSGGKRSLDDFARAFFDIDNGRLQPRTYTFEDVAAALNQVQHNDWPNFLRARLDNHSPGAPLDGLARSGWQLTYTEQPNSYAEADEKKNKYADFTHSLGLTLSTKDLRITDVRWEGPAFKAGLASSMTLVAVNGIAFSTERLNQAITDAKKTGKPIELLINNLDHLTTVRVDYQGGLRYPHLERIADTPDRLAEILSARKK